jgi:hypothetical protein
MALRLAFALLALAAISACSSSDSAGNMYARDPYAVSASRNPGSFSEAFGSRSCRRDTKRDARRDLRQLGCDGEGLLGAAA